MSEWQSVSESLPRYEQRVLATSVHKNYPSNDYVAIARRVKTDAKGEWWLFDHHTDATQGVTFWQPLSVAPKLPRS